MKKSFKQHFMHLDPNNNNGAMFIGIDGIVVKSHGGANDIAFANAIEVAIKLAKQKINDHIKDELADFSKNPSNIALELINKIKNTFKDE